VWAPLRLRRSRNRSSSRWRSRPAFFAGRLSIRTRPFDSGGKGKTRDKEIDMARLTGKFVWFECVTAEQARAKAFYGDVIGWKTQPFKAGGETYDMATVGDKPVGGYASPGDDAKSAPPHWVSYVSVDDVDATAKLIKAEGGALLEGPFDVPEVGRMARVADPQGAVFWLMAGTGDDTPDAPSRHGEFHWNELWTRDADAAVRFYQKVFGYSSKSMAMPDGTYHVLEKGGVPRGGIMASTDEKVPPMWLPYVAVDDCDAVVARAEKLGATIHAPPTDIPEVGRFAVLADSNGATFAVVKPAP
jgi:predicted enzyme related to lactoylglutathione lyase